MLHKKPFWYCCWIFCIAYYIYIIYGIINPLQDNILKILWLMFIILGPLTHILEFPKAIPIGKNAGSSLGKTIIMTFLFGITWWLPVKRGIIE